MTVMLIDITTAKALACDENSLFTHNSRMSKVQLPDSAQAYFCKELPSPAEGYAELLAQEFFRLIIPGQPETLLASNPSTNTYFILSAELPDFDDIPRDKPELFMAGLIVGLGQVVVVAQFLEEDDLKFGNIGLCGSTIKKIDGNRCFRSLWAETNRIPLTTKCLADLPYPTLLNPDHWLDICLSGTQRTSYAVPAVLREAPAFQKEINDAILSIILLTDDYLQRLVLACMPADSNAERYLNFLKTRRNELCKAAESFPQFQDYLNSEAASANKQKHIQRLQNFKVSNVALIEGRERTKLLESLEQRYNDLKQQINKVRTRQELCKQLIGVIRAVPHYFEHLTTCVAVDKFVQEKNTFIDESLKRGVWQEVVRDREVLKAVRDKKARLGQAAETLKPRLIFLDKTGYERIYSAVQSYLNYESRLATDEPKLMKFLSALETIRSNFCGSDEDALVNQREFVTECKRAINQCQLSYIPKLQKETVAFRQALDACLPKVKRTSLFGTQPKKSNAPVIYHCKV